MKKKIMTAVLIACSIFLSFPTSGKAAQKLDLGEDGSIEVESLLNGETYTHSQTYEGCKLLNGIDVSHWQGDIDWEAVSQSDVDFALIRIGHRNGKTGVIEEDRCYEYNLREASANGIRTGAYIFSQAISVKEAKQEANYVLKRIKGYDITMPVVIDFEHDSSQKDGGRVATAGLSKAKATKIVDTFCKKIKAAGYQPMIYADITRLTGSINAKKLAKKYPIWLARWNTFAGTGSGADKTYYTGKYTFWQYSCTKEVDGIEGAVDCDFWYLDTKSSPKNLTVKAQEADQIKIKWSKVSLANGYQIYRSSGNGEDYELVANTNKTSYVDTDVRSSTSYSYKVRAYWKISGSTYKSKSSEIVTALTKPVEVQEVDGSASDESGQVTVSWKSQKRVDGYIVYRSTKKNKGYKSVAVVEGRKNNSYKDTDLKSDKSYYYKLAAYVLSEGEKLKGVKSVAVKIHTN